MNVMPQRPTILGVQIDPVTWVDIDKFVRSALIQASSKMITTVNGEIALKASRNHEYRKVLNSADMAIPDSTNIVWVGRLKGLRFPAITPGSELVWRISQIAAEMKKSVYFLGGRDDVAMISASRIKEKYPDIEIAGFSNADPDDPKTAEMVRRKNPDIVFVAYGAPRQELWIAQNKEKITAKVMVGIGGTFDMIAGKLKRAPEWMRRMHLEWLWRLYLQPGRIGRVINAVVVFPIKALFN